jgi:hypothetical protein
LVSKPLPHRLTVTTPEHVGVYWYQMSLATWSSPAFLHMASAGPSVVAALVEKGVAPAIVVAASAQSSLAGAGGGPPPGTVAAPHTRAGAPGLKSVTVAVPAPGGTLQLKRKL